MNISPVTEDDLEQLALLYQQLIPNEFSLEKMSQALERIDDAKNPLILAAKIDGQLVGTLLAVHGQMLFGPCKSFVIVEDVVVDCRYRRQGVGTALIKYLESHAKNHNCSYIMLVTDFDRIESQKFYGSLGYKSSEYCAFKKHL